MARIDQEGRLEVYWWSPESNRWQLQILNDAVDGIAPNFQLEGQLTSLVSSQSGEFNVIGRSVLGDMYRFFWRPSEVWRLERL